MLKSILSSYRDLPKNIHLLFFLEFSLSLIHVAFILILNIYLRKQGFSDPWLCNILAVIFAKQKKYSFAAKYFKILTDLFPNDYESFLLCFSKAA